MIFIIMIFQFLTLSVSAGEETPAQATVTVDAARRVHTMKGGLGASWHAISKETPLNLEKYRYLPEGKTPRGSAYGGNPPVTDTKAWQQIMDHASWLGLNFIRVEMSQRMVEPERGKFDWENEEMQALYKILDWCQKNNADVFFQQMWRFVEWNAIPGVHPLISAPRNLDDFINSITTLMEYLVFKKGYSCIRYFGMSNEPPGGTWGSWWEYGPEKGSINDAWQKLHEAFVRKNIPVIISGPGWTDMPPFREEKMVFAPYIGSVDIHSYGGVTPLGEENLKKWAGWAHNQQKPFFLTEFGNMNLGWRDDNPGPKTFNAALSNASDVIRGLRANVDGFNRWSFTNRGDLDGQWQLIVTWDREKKQYLREVVPEPQAYYGFAILSRFLSKYSTTLACSVNKPDSLLMAGALISPSGELSVFMVNNSQAPLEVSLNIISYPGKKLHVYQVSESLAANPGFRLNPVSLFYPARREIITLPPRSITTVSSYSLKNNQKGIILK